MILRTNTRSMQSLLIKILGDKHRDYVIIALNWSNTVGAYLAKYSKVIKIEKKVLFIAVENSVMLQEFVLLRDDLLARLNCSLPVVIEDIIFFIESRTRAGRTMSCPMKNEE